MVQKSPTTAASLEMQTNKILSCSSTALYRQRCPPLSKFRRLILTAEEPSNTPPFVFDAEAQGITPENAEKSVPSHASLVRICMPDLEMHPATEQEQDDDSSGEDEDLEPDGALCPGKWYGRWSRTFIARAQAGLPLGHLDKVVRDADHVWGIKVKLVPLANSITTDRVEFSNGEEGKLRLESYQIRATIQEVYVAPRFFEED